MVIVIEVYDLKPKNKSQQAVCEMKRMVRLWSVKLFRAEDKPGSVRRVVVYMPQLQDRSLDLLPCSPVRCQCDAASPPSSPYDQS